MSHENFSLFLPERMIIFVANSMPVGKAAKINKKQTHETKYMVYNSSGYNVCRL
jgi:hypothetical protein